MTWQPSGDSSPATTPLAGRPDRRLRRARRLDFQDLCLRGWPATPRLPDFRRRHEETAPSPPSSPQGHGRLHVTVEGKPPTPAALTPRGQRHCPAGRHHRADRGPGPTMGTADLQRRPRRRRYRHEPRAPPGRGLGRDANLLARRFARAWPPCSPWRWADRAQRRRQLRLRVCVEVVEQTPPWPRNPATDLSWRLAAGRSDLGQPVVPKSAAASATATLSGLLPVLDGLGPWRQRHRSEHAADRSKEPEYVLASSFVRGRPELRRHSASHSPVRVRDSVMLSEASISFRPERPFTAFRGQNRAEWVSRTLNEAQLCFSPLTKPAGCGIISVLDTLIARRGPPHLGGGRAGEGVIRNSKIEITQSLQGRERPSSSSVTVDAVIFALRDGDLQVLLVKRGHPPYRNVGHPGGFVISTSRSTRRRGASQKRPA